MIEQVLVAVGLLLGQVEITDSAKPYIYVSTDPIGATVEVDGKILEKSDVLVEVRPGQHSVTISLRGFKTEDLKVRVRAGTIERVVRKLQPDIDWLIAELLRAEDKRPILDRLAALGAAAEPAVPTLIDLFQQSDLELRAAAGETLAQIGKPSAASLARFVESKDLYLRLMAARYLARIGPDALDTVLHLAERVKKGLVGCPGNRHRPPSPKKPAAVPSGAPTITLPSVRYYQLDGWRNEELPDAMQVVCEELPVTCIPELLRVIESRSGKADEAAFVLTFMKIPPEHAEHVLETHSAIRDAFTDIVLPMPYGESNAEATLIRDTYHWVSYHVFWNVLVHNPQVVKQLLIRGRPDRDRLLGRLDHTYWPRYPARDVVPELLDLRETANDSRRDRILSILARVGLADEAAASTVLDAIDNGDSSNTASLLRQVASHDDWTQAPLSLADRAVSVCSQMVHSGNTDYALWHLLGMLMKRTEEAKSVIFECLTHESPDVRAMAAGCLESEPSDIPDEVWKHLEQLLEDEDAKVRLAGVKTLAARGRAREKWLPVAETLLKTEQEDWEVRLGIIPVLWAQNRDWSRVGPVIVEALQEETDEYHPRELVVETLLDIRPPVEMLRRDVNDLLAKAYWKHGVKEAMRELDPEAVNALVPHFLELLDDESPERRSVYIGHLGDLGLAAFSAIPKIAEELKFDEGGGDEKTARVAAIALGRIAGANDGTAQVVRILAAPDLIHLLGYYNRETRSTAAQALGMIGPPATDAEPELRKAALYLDRQSRLHAQIALASITGDLEPAIDALRRAISTHIRRELAGTREAAMAAIAILSKAKSLPDEAVQVLEEAADHPCYDIRQPAREVLDTATKAKD